MANANGNITLIQLIDALNERGLYLDANLDKANVPQAYAIVSDDDGKRRFLNRGRFINEKRELVWAWGIGEEVKSQDGEEAVS